MYAPSLKGTRLNLVVLVKVFITVDQDNQIWLKRKLDIKESK